MTKYQIISIIGSKVVKSVYTEQQLKLVFNFGNLKNVAANAIRDGYARGISLIGELLVTRI